MYIDKIVINILFKQFNLEYLFRNFVSHFYLELIIHLNLQIYFLTICANT